MCLGVHGVVGTLGDGSRGHYYGAVAAFRPGPTRAFPWIAPPPPRRPKRAKQRQPDS